MSNIRLGDRVRVTDERRAELDENQLKNCALEGVVEKVDPVAGFCVFTDGSLFGRKVSFWDAESLEVVE